MLLALGFLHVDLLRVVPGNLFRVVGLQVGIKVSCFAVTVFYFKFRAH